METIRLPRILVDHNSTPGGVLYSGLDDAVVPPPEEQPTVAAADIPQVDHCLRLAAGGRPRAPHVGALPNHKEIRCLRFTKLCWVRNNMNIIMKPSNSPTQEKLGQKWGHLGQCFPQQKKTISWVGIGFT